MSFPGSISMKTFAFPLVAWFVFLPGVSAVDKGDSEEIRARFRKRSAEPLGIVEPIKITRVAYFKDGGTVGIEVTDAKNRTHEFSLDGRFLPTKDEPNNVGTRNLYLGAMHPTRKDARKVEHGGPEEQALYGVLLRWADAHPQRDSLYDEAKSLPETSGDLWETRAFFLKLDRRFTNR